MVKVVNTPIANNVVGKIKLLRQQVATRAGRQDAPTFSSHPSSPVEVLEMASAPSHGQV